MKLSVVIQKIEREAGELEELSAKGSPVSSMAEDLQAGATAKVLRGLVEELKQVDSL